MPGVPRSRLRVWLLRLGGSALILTVLLLFVPLDEVRAGLSRVSTVQFILVLLAFIAGHVLAAMKWWILMQSPFGFPIALRAHFAGLAANLCLPTVAGGDVVRAGIAYRACHRGAVVAAASTADRLIDLCALAAIALICAFLSGASPVAVATNFLLVTIVAGLLVWILPRQVARMWERFPSLPFRDAAEALAQATLNLGRSPIRLFIIWCLSVGVQILFILLALSLALAMGLEIGFAPWAFAWALAKIISILPVAMNGLGLREASLAALLAPFGAPTGLVVAAGLVWQLVLLATGALGALVLVLTPYGAPGQERNDRGADTC